MRVLHLLDSTCGWEQRIAITQMLDRFDPKIIQGDVASIDFEHSNALMNEVAISSLPRRMLLPALAAPSIRSYCNRNSVDLIHAWGAPSATAARAGCDETFPLVVSVFDPGLESSSVRMLLTVQASGRTAVSCSAERVRRRLVEQGIEFDSCAVVRPGVDFKTIGRAQKSDLRKQLGIADDALVAITPPPPSHRGGHRAAVWAAAMRSNLGEDNRILVPGKSAELHDLRRLAMGSAVENTVIFTEDNHRFEELLPIADVLICASTDDISTTAVAWAMASNVTVISPATYAVAELIANDLNGILFKAEDRWTRLGRQICARLPATADAQKLREVARGQAYEVFSVRRSADQHRQLYENMLNQLPPGENIADPATITAGA